MKSFTWSPPPTDMQVYLLTSPMRGRGSSNCCVCVCVCYRSSERYECFKRQSKITTESTQLMEQNYRRNWTKYSRF